MTTFGISHSEVFTSAWFVIQAVNTLKEFDIVYPANHNKQREIADGFLDISAVGFGCCSAISGCDSGKFYYRRKLKFGLNCQAACDARSRILDMAIQYPGSTSDILAFEGMTLCDRMEDGLLAPVFLVTIPCMATPCSAVSGDSMDSYNFYHLQVTRIRIECTFGILTHRWAILQFP
jgi:hypothetical protein